MEDTEQVKFLKAQGKHLRDNMECARFAMERLASYIGRNAVIDQMILEVQTHQRRVQEGLYEWERVATNQPIAKGAIGG